MTKWNKRTDFNQKGIVDGLRQIGVQAILTNFGQDFPDLLCGYRDVWVLLEVKEESGSSLDRGQLKFLANATAPVAVVTTLEEAIEEVTYVGVNKRSRYDYSKIHGWLLANPLQHSLSVKKFRALIQDS